MVYGTEAVLPSDVTFGSPRVENFDQSSADIARELEINCMEERHLISCLRTTKYLEANRRYHNRNVKDRSFVVGDLVLKWKTSHEGTSYPRHGKDPPKSHALHLTDWRTQTKHACLILST